MTHEEMIAVITAHKEGKQIQFWSCGEWHDMKHDEIMWNFGSGDYRVKPEPKYRPYANAEEFLKDQEIHGPHVKACGQYHLPTLIDNECVVMVSVTAVVARRYADMERLFNWQDGAPCGVKEE